ncbi:MAG: DegT/DnrJ/EryC1/StrS family aminotransferase [Rubripirellula sp.]
MSKTDSNEEPIQVPFFRPDISEDAVAEVAECIRSGWLTTGPRVKQFEKNFAASVLGEHAVAVNSCTAALHLAVEALGLQAGQGVLVPTMTFAATAEIVLYRGAIPILVDCDPETFNMDLHDAAAKLKAHADIAVVGIIPVHVAGQMMDLDQIDAFAEEHGLWVVEDAAHAFPSAFRSGPDAPWRRCGENTSRVSCYSFYANKTITTGEGGMAVTADESLADRMRQMSLHGLSHDAWKRYQGSSAWDYRIVAPGYKYNMTDVAASIGLHQLARAEELRLEREEIADFYDEALRDLPQLDLPVRLQNRIHSWHLYPLRLRLDRLTIDRNEFMEQLRQQGVGCSVHWRPLHLHTYYEENWKPTDCPVATEVWQRLVTLPVFPGMRDEERTHVVSTVTNLCQAST